LDPKSHKEVEFVEKVLTNNKYPPKLINSIKRKRRHKQLNAQIEKSKPDATVVIPYVPALSEKIMRLGRRANIRVVCKMSDTLRNRLVKFKHNGPLIKKSYIRSHVNVAKNILVKLVGLIDKSEGVQSRPKEG
jgi:hypothetical protein